MTRVSLEECLDTYMYSAYEGTGNKLHVQKPTLTFCVILMEQVEALFNNLFPRYTQSTLVQYTQYAQRVRISSVRRR